MANKGWVKSYIIKNELDRPTGNNKLNIYEKSLEEKFNSFWELILPFLNSEADLMQHLADLENGMRMKKMKVTLIKSLVGF